MYIVFDKNGMGPIKQLNSDLASLLTDSNQFLTISSKIDPLTILNVMVIGEVSPVTTSCREF